MTTAMTTREIAIETLRADATAYAASAVAGNTRRAYNSDFNQFSVWCDQHGLCPLPAAPATVSAYLTNLARIGRKVSTVERHKAGIRWMHEEHGCDDPTAAVGVRKNLRGLRRELGVAPEKKSPTLANDIKAMIATLPENTLGLRDKAILLLGFAGGFRRSELAALTVEDVEEVAEGVRILLRRSKTDQEGRGRYVGISRLDNPAYCPVRALYAWLSAAGIQCGPVFRRVNRHGQLGAPILPQVVGAVVKRSAEAAGLDPARYGGHSLRAGCVTQAFLNGAQVPDIMKQTGHRSTDTVNGYIRPLSLFDSNVSGMLGLD